MINCSALEKLLCHHTFEELTQGVTDPEDLLTPLNKADWKNRVFDEQSFPASALTALNKGDIPLTVFVTTMFYWSLRQHHSKEEIEVLPLFIEGHLNESAWQIMQETFYPDPSAKISQCLSLNEPYLKGDQRDRFLAIVKGLPLSEQTFFIIPEIFHLRSICREIQKSTSINVFNRSRNQRLFPSFGMMQAYLDALEEQAVKITPVIGFSSVDEIRQNGWSGTRDMAIPFPHVNLPREVDGFSSTESYDLIYHDFYHAILVSHIPSNHRKAFMEVDRIVNLSKELFSNQAIKEFLSDWSERIVDMEHSIYRPEIRRSGNHSTSALFWLSLSSSLMNTFDRRSIIQNKKWGTRFTTTIRNNMQLLAENDVVEKVMREILSAFERLEKYGIVCREIEALGQDVEKKLLSLTGLQLNVIIKNNVIVQGKNYYK